MRGVIRNGGRNRLGTAIGLFIICDFFALSQNALELLKMSSLFPKVGDNDLSMEIIRAYDACELLQADINRYYSSRSPSTGDRVPWLQLNDMEEYTVDITTAIDAIDTFLMKR